MSSEWVSFPVPPVRTVTSVPIGVIVCDDHPVFARGLAVTLEHEDDEIQVVAITTVAEQAEQNALDLSPDVVLIDLHMPGVDGIEGARRIRQVSPLTKVLVMTSGGDAPADVYRAVRAGACGYVAKDGEAAGIARTVRSAWAGELAIPAELAHHVVADVDGTDAGWLSEAERAVLAAVRGGGTGAEVAARLDVAERTVWRRVEDIYAKLHLTDQLDVARRFAVSPVQHGE